MLPATVAEATDEPNLQSEPLGRTEAVETDERTRKKALERNKKAQRTFRLRQKVCDS